tara:strand:- start:262 stop:489 length:228 start_codon:yes stop_codon:yes gene_type:complete
MNSARAKFNPASADSPLLLEVSTPFPAPLSRIENWTFSSTISIMTLLPLSFLQKLYYIGRYLIMQASVQQPENES